MKKFTALVLAAIMLLAVVPAAGVAAEDSLSDGLVLRYTFDSDGAAPSTVKDVSGNNFNGVVVNVSQQVGGGRPGQGSQQTVTKQITVENGAAVFPGSENVSSGWRGTYVNGAAIKIPEAARSGLGDYTVSMWVKADGEYSFSGVPQRFFDFGVSTTDSIFLRYQLSSGELRFQDRGIASGKDDTASYAQQTGVNDMVDKWALLTVVYSKNEQKATVYVNGEELMSKTGLRRSIGDISALSDQTYGMYLGRTMWYNDGEKANNPEYKGLMDDVRIYRRTLGADEVMELYKTTNPEGDKTVTGAAAPDDVYTLAGVAPALPATVKVTLANGSEEYAEVIWEDVAAGKYAAVGTFTVNGTVKGTAISVQVTVHVVSEPEDSIKSGLIASYTFDGDGSEPTVIKDVSGSGNDALVLNNVRNDFFEGTVDNHITVANGAAVFPGCTEHTNWWGEADGTDAGAALQLPNDFNRGVNSYTVSMWVKADSEYIYADRYQRLFDFGNRGGDLDDSIYAAYFLKQDRLDVYDYRDNNRAGVEHYFNGEGPFTDRWGMLTVSYDYASKKADVYVNGEKIETIENMPRGLDGLGSLNDNSNGLYIGRNIWSNQILDSNPDFKGQMDNIRIYGRSLGEAEVEALYNATNPQKKAVITRNISVLDADGREIYNTSETVDGWENSRYTDKPEETYTYGGKVYYLLKELSDLTIENVDDTDRSVTVVYTVKTASFEKAAVADTYTSTQNNGNDNYGNDDLRVTSTGGDGKASYDRYAFIRFPGSDGYIFGGSLKVFVDKIENNRYTTYTLHAIDKEYAEWNEYGLKWSNQGDIVNNSTEIATAGLSPSVKGEWLEFDISEYLRNNPGREYYSFYISCDTCATYIYSRENGENPPTISYLSEGQLVTVNYMADGTTLLTETVPAPKGQTFTYDGRRNLIAKDGKVYVYGSGASMDKVDEEHSVMTIIMKETDDYGFEDITASAYYDEAAPLPGTAVLKTGDYSLELPVVFDQIVMGQVGVFEVTGVAEGLDVPATVKAYGRYYNENGDLLGYASKVKIRYLSADGGYEANPVEVEQLLTGSSISADLINYYPQLENAGVDGDNRITEPYQTVTVTGELKDGVSADAGAYLEGDDPSAYTLNVTGTAANVSDEPGAVAVIAARYDGSGKLVGVDTDKVSLNAGMTGREELSCKFDYNRETEEDLRIYVWSLAEARPLSEVILASELHIADVAGLIPEYGDVKENVLRANDYYQAHNGANARTFWDIAAYHTGNMETYFTFGGDNYLDYSFEWANSRNWMGNRNTSTPKEQWTWNYPSGDSDNTTDVLFGDWQICFQTFLDLYLVEPDRANISRVEEVMGYQITKEDDDYWWWADALYMVPPILTKMYLNTGDITYIDKLYDYYRFSAELMYDGDCGIPNRGTSEFVKGEEYTTSAESYKKNGSAFSNPDNYANLFYRDSNYVYPLNANSGHEGEKNFWARGNGWVFAGLAKILTDLPESHESYPYFVNLYREMAAAIIACQRQDDEGRGFWTQSMLQDYPKGQNGNSWGYETSGTAFFTYGLFWGLNSGLLDEGKYLEPALRGWKYLSEVALQDSGKVGYTQAIGSNATQATAQSSEQSFGYGAFLLAGCEVSRWVGGVEENNADYLKRRLRNAIAFSGGKMYFDGETADSGAFVEGGTLYLPVIETAEKLGFNAVSSGGGCNLTDEVNGGTKAVEDVVDRNGDLYAPADSLAAAMDRYATVWNGVTVISHKRAVFYGCEDAVTDYLSDLLK